MFDKYPYTNFHELNLEYFIQHFKEIFDEWEELYNTLTTWKDATDAANAAWKTGVETDLATWKAGVEAELTAREEALRAELEAWKDATETDIGTWESDTLATLEAWKASAEAAFEVIRLQAAASATAAAASEAAAATSETNAAASASSAATDAASIASSAAQIAENQSDIADLENALEDVEGFTENLMIFVETVDDTSGYYRQVTEFSPARKYCLKITAGSAGTHTFQTGPIASVNYMVDTLAENIVLAANEVYYIYDYVPSQTGLIYVRDSVGGAWSVSVFEIVGTKNTLDDLAATKTELETLENSLGKSPNLFDKTAVTDNYYYSVTNGSAPELRSNENFCALMIDVKPSTKYTVNYNDFSYGEVNENNIVVSTRSQSTFTTTANTVKLTISINKNHKDYFMIVEGETLPDTYEPYGEYTKYAIREKTYEVGTGKQFTSLIDCFEALKDNKDWKTILIYEGTYDIFDEIGGTDFVNTITSDDTWRGVSVFVPDNTRLIGVGDVKLEFLPEDNEITSLAAGYLSALNISGSVEIENIKIRAKNCRYCIHDETSSLSVYNNTTRKYKNVECVKETGTLGNVQAYACGFQQGMKFDFKDCVFKSNRGNAFSMHNSSTGGVTINIENCVIITDANGYSVELINLSGNQVRNIVNVLNTYMERTGTGKLLAVTGTNVVNTFDVTLIGCSDIGDTTIDISGNLYPIKQYNKHTSA